VKVYYASKASAITTLPDFYQLYAVLYAAAMANYKYGDNMVAASLMNQYKDAILSGRVDTHDRLLPGAAADFEAPDGYQQI